MSTRQAADRRVLVADELVADLAAYSFDHRRNHSWPSGRGEPSRASTRIAVMAMRRSRGWRSLRVRGRSTLRTCGMWPACTASVRTGRHGSLERRREPWQVDSSCGVRGYRMLGLLRGSWAWVGASRRNGSASSGCQWRVGLFEHDLLGEVLTSKVLRRIRAVFHG